MLPTTAEFALTQHSIFEDDWNEAEKQGVSLTVFNY